MGKRSIVDGVAGPYVWISYNEAYQMAKKFGSFLVKRGIEEKSNIGLYSINRQEWILAEQGSFMYNYCTVPLYDTLGNEAVEHIINQAELPIIVASKDKLAKLIGLKSSMPSLKIIVSMDQFDEEQKKAAKEAGAELVFYKDAEKEGGENMSELRLPTPEDLATICYTSGTTGLPKGVILTHRNILSVGESYQYAGKHGAGTLITHNDVHISYLPLAHVLERAVFAIFTGLGSRIGFYQGDTLKLLEDVAELKPTLFISVPRLFNRIYDKIWANVKAKGGIGEALFRIAFASKKANLSSSVKHFLWDALVFSKVKARLGGRVRFMLSGSAPLSSEVMEFLRIAFACEVVEGYGQTETSAGATVTDVGDYSVGHVGAPFPCCEVKLVDVPDMGYTSKDEPFPRGEICFRGHNCFQGYYKLPDKTAETLDEDKWVHSGDIGLWDDKGRLKIIDRKKNIFKLAQGEYIAPEKIENVYVNHELVAQAFVYGDSLQATLVSVIIPDEEQLKKWAESSGLSGKSFAELCKEEKVKKHILTSLQKHGKEHDLKGFENIKNVYLETELFSVDNDMLTPTFKIKRHQVKKKFQQQIDDMYAEIAS